VSVVVLGSVLVVLLVTTLAVRNDRASFAGGSFGTIEKALQSHGLHICHTVDRPDGQANQATDSRLYDVAFDCSTDAAARVVVDRFAAVDDRDAAIRNHEVLVRPRGSGVTYTYGRFTIYVLGQSDDDAQDTINTALRGLGAK
jgi:hypothetical protein